MSLVLAAVVLVGWDAPRADKKPARPVRKSLEDRRIEQRGERVAKYEKWGLAAIEQDFIEAQRAEFVKFLPVEIRDKRKSIGGIEDKAYKRKVIAEVKALESIQKEMDKGAVHIPFLDLDDLSHGCIGFIKGSRPVQQIIDGENMTVLHAGDVVWVKTNTDGFTDDSTIGFSSLYRYDGTKQYVTALGSTKTVPVISRVAAADLPEKPE